MSSTITLLFSGDFAPLVKREEITDKHFADLQSLFQNIDSHITNLESPLTNAGKLIEKTGPAIKSIPEAVNLLKQAKVNIACMANNHIFDYGEEGLFDTMEVCQKNGIETLGIVNGSAQGEGYLVKTIKGKKIGFVNVCEHEFSVRDEGLPGAKGYDPVDAFYMLNGLKQKTDYVIVVYHGGNEYYPLPSPALRKTFQYLVDIGADAVIGHHTHVMSGYEYYNNKPLVYSLGNFFFPEKDEHPRWYEGLLCELKLEEAKLDLAFTPVLHDPDTLQNWVIRDNRSKEIFKHLEQLNTIIVNEQQLKQEWNKFVHKKGEALTRLFLLNTRVQKLFNKFAFTRKILFKALKIKKRKALLFNLIRCQALNEIIRDSLKKPKQ